MRKFYKAALGLGAMALASCGPAADASYDIIQGRPISVSGSSDFGSVPYSIVSVVIELDNGEHVLATGIAQDYRNAIEADALITAEINDGDDDYIHIEGNYYREYVGKYRGVNRFEIKRMVIDDYQIDF